jgi:hypothetical protein
MPTRNNAGFSSTPDLAGLAGLAMMKDRQADQPRSSLDMELISDIGDNKPMGGGYVGAIPASFATQMAYANGGMSRHRERNEEQDMLSRIMMARMNSLEEGFREVVHEMRENLKRQETHDRSRSRSRSRSLERRYAQMQTRRGKEKQEKEKEKEDEEPVGGRTPTRRAPASKDVSRPESLRGELTKVIERPEETKAGAGEG